MDAKLKAMAAVTAAPVVTRSTPHGATRWGVQRLGDWADRRDAHRGVAVDQAVIDALPPIGAFATAWAAVKFVLMTAAAPVAAPAVAARAVFNHRYARQLIGDFPHQFGDLAGHRHPLPPANRARRLHSPELAFISSDLHRCTAGRNDWPARQGTKTLYPTILGFYAEREAHLVENGDVEDYWTLGGSCYGAVYDIVRLAQWAVPGRRSAAARIELYRGHLERIIANNPSTYRQIEDGFVRHGRYHRTVGNHDDVYLDRTIARMLRDRIGVEPVDWLTFDAEDGETAAIIAHGHHTDGWCAPHRARLGKLSAWVAHSLSDVPYFDAPSGLAAPRVTEAILAGRAANHLLEVNPVFGVNRSYDSLDEELLFAAMGDATQRGPWLLFGHTHIPVDRPRSRGGARWRRYANSGCGVLPGLVTGLEWHHSRGSSPALRLVGWTYADGDTPPEAVAAHDHGRPVARWVLQPTDDGRLQPTVEPFPA